MSTKNTKSSIKNLSVAETKKQFGRFIEKIQFTVEDTYNITLLEKNIVEVDSLGITVSGVYQIGDSGFPNKDTFRYAEKIDTLLSHPTCETENTNGYPVWFENAAWCMSCESLLDATDTIVYDVTCQYCGDTFDKGDVMRATFPKKLHFKQYIKFEKPCKTVEAVKEELKQIADR